MPDGADLLGAFEEHSPDGIRALLAASVSPTALIKGRRPIDSLIETYLRSQRFAECLQVMMDAGAAMDDPLLEAILLDNVDGLRRLLAISNGSVQRKLHPLCAFTCCRGVSVFIVALSPAPDLQPALFTPTPKAARRVAEFFTGQVNNDNTRRALM